MKNRNNKCNETLSALHVTTYHRSTHHATDNCRKTSLTKYQHASHNSTRQFNRDKATGVCGFGPHFPPRPVVGYASNPRENYGYHPYPLYALDYQSPVLNLKMRKRLPELDKFRQIFAAPNPRNQKVLPHFTTQTYNLQHRSHFTIQCDTTANHTAIISLQKCTNMHRFQHWIQKISEAMPHTPILSRGYHPPQTVLRCPTSTPPWLRLCSLASTPCYQLTQYSQSTRISRAHSDVEPRSFVDHSNSLLLNLASIGSTAPSTSVSAICALPTLYAPGLTHSCTATRAWWSLCVFTSLYLWHNHHNVLSVLSCSTVHGTALSESALPTKRRRHCSF